MREYFHEGYFIRIQGQKVFIASIEPIETTLVQLDFEDTPEDKTMISHWVHLDSFYVSQMMVSILAPPTEDNMQKHAIKIHCHAACDDWAYWWQRIFLQEMAEWWLRWWGDVGDY